MIPETPHTRKEMYLARIAGQEVELPQMPHTREEMYLDAIANNGGGGGGGGETFVVNLSFDDETGNPTVDKTNAEIYAAFQSGKRIEMHQRNDSDVYFKRLADIGPDHARFVSNFLQLNGLGPSGATYAIFSYTTVIHDDQVTNFGGKVAASSTNN